MTSVWIVTRAYDYEGEDVAGVFSTEEKALRYIASQAAEGISSGAKLRHSEATVDVHEVKS